MHRLELRSPTGKRKFTGSRCVLPPGKGKCTGSSCVLRPETEVHRLALRSPGEKRSFTGSRCVLQAENGSSPIASRFPVGKRKCTGSRCVLRAENGASPARVAFSGRKTEVHRSRCVLRAENGSSPARVAFSGPDLARNLPTSGSPWRTAERGRLELRSPSRNRPGSVTLLVLRGGTWSVTGSRSDVRPETGLAAAPVRSSVADRGATPAPARLSVADHGAAPAAVGCPAGTQSGTGCRFVSVADDGPPQGARHAPTLRLWATVP